MNGRTLSNESEVGMPRHFCIQSDITYSYTSAPDKITDKVKELDIVYSRIWDYYRFVPIKTTVEGEGTAYLRRRYK